MKLNEFIERLKKENLTNAFFMNNGQIPYGVCIYQENELWFVYSTDERCAKNDYQNL